MVDLAIDDTDEDAKLAEVRTEVVHLDEDKVLEGVLAEDVYADEDMDLVTRIFYNLGQVVTHLEAILVIGPRAARAVARAVLRQAPEGPTAEVAVDMTEYVNLEDLTNGKTARPVIRRVKQGLRQERVFPRCMACGGIHAISYIARSSATFGMRPAEEASCS